MNMGEGGFRHAAFVGTEGNLLVHHLDRTDLRSKFENSGRRKNITDKNGGYQRLLGAPIHGMKFDRILECTKCKKWKEAGYYINHAVSSIDREKVGMNIRCRDCQTSNYTKDGYKKENNFVTDSDVEDDMLTESDEDDLIGKCHQCGVMPIAEGKKCKHGHASLCDACITDGVYCVTCDDLLLV